MFLFMLVVYLLSSIWIFCISVEKYFLISSFFNVFYCAKMKSVFISPCFTVQFSGAKHIHVGFQLGKPLSLVSSNHSSGYCVCFLPTRSLFSFWGVMAAHITYPGMRGFETISFPLSEREDFSLAVCGRRWLNPHVHRCFKIQQNGFQSQCMHSLPEPMVTKHSKLGGLNNRCLLISQFWRLEVQNEDVGSTGFLKRIWKRICSCLSPHFLNPQLFYLFFTPLSLCACPHLCLNVSLYISETGWDLEPFTAVVAPRHTSHVTKHK